MSVEQQEYVWARWRAGESLRAVAAVVSPRRRASVTEFVKSTGGVRRPVPRRWAGHLSVLKREEISRGIAAGEGVPRAVLVQLPVGAASWLLLNGAARSGIPADLAVRLVIAISLWATVGLLLARLAADAATDPLTGLGNRRSLERCSPTCGSGMRSSSSM